MFCSLREWQWHYMAPTLLIQPNYMADSNFTLFAHTNLIIQHAVLVGRDGLKAGEYA